MSAPCKRNVLTPVLCFRRALYKYKGSKRPYQTISQIARDKPMGWKTKSGQCPACIIRPEFKSLKISCSPGGISILMQIRFGGILQFVQESMLFKFQIYQTDNLD